MEPIVICENRPTGENLTKDIYSFMKAAAKARTPAAVKVINIIIIVFAVIYVLMHILLAVVEGVGSLKEYAWLDAVVFITLIWKLIRRPLRLRASASRAAKILGSVDPSSKDIKEFYPERIVSSHDGIRTETGYETIYSVYNGEQLLILSNKGNTFLLLINKSCITKGSVEDILALVGNKNSG